MTMGNGRGDGDNLLIILQDFFSFVTGRHRRQQKKIFVGRRREAKKKSSIDERRQTFSSTMAGPVFEKLFRLRTGRSSKNFFGRPSVDGDNKFSSFGRTSPKLFFWTAGRL
jgi:hypothetical protein